jgi:hypothetical protein
MAKDQASEFSITLLRAQLEMMTPLCPFEVTLRAGNPELLAHGSTDDGDCAEGKGQSRLIRVGSAFVKLLAGSHMSRASTSIG